MRVRTLGVAVARAGLSLVMAGCSGPGPGSGPGSGGGAAGSGTGSGSSVSGSSGSSSGGPTSTGAAGQLTGVQLSKALLLASDFPASFAMSQQGSADSGGKLEKAAATYDASTISPTARSSTSSAARPRHRDSSPESSHFRADA